MTDLYQHKLEKMSDEALAEECLHHGRVMEYRSVADENMSKQEKHRALLAFTEATKRASLEEDRDMLLVAIKVLKWLP